MERFHGFVDRCLWVEAVNLKQVDVVRLKALQRGIDRVEDRIAGQARLVNEVSLVAKVRMHECADGWVRVNEPIALREDENLFSRNVILRDKVY